MSGAGREFCGMPTGRRPIDRHSGSRRSNIIHRWNWLSSYDNRNVPFAEVARGPRQMDGSRSGPPVHRRQPPLMGSHMGQTHEAICQPRDVAAMLRSIASPTRAQNARSRTQTFGRSGSNWLPIALYPDDLLSQVLMASTYPLEVVEAARWSRRIRSDRAGACRTPCRTSLGSEREGARRRPADAAMMNDQINGRRIRRCVPAQQSAVLDAVQRLRARADAAGNLKSTPQQKVTRVKRPANVFAGSGAPATAYTIAPSKSGRILRPDLRSDRCVRHVAV